MKQQCIKAIVSGRVQGVFFRDSTRTEALHLGITGHAINLPDGTVEVVACGEMEKLEKLTKWLQRGPEFAQVSGVSVSELSIDPPSRFVIG